MVFSFFVNREELVPTDADTQRKNTFAGANKTPFTFLFFI
jgi:hypothetical protein